MNVSSNDYPVIAKELIRAINSARLRGGNDPLWEAAVSGVAFRLHESLWCGEEPGSNLDCGRVGGGVPVYDEVRKQVDAVLGNLIDSECIGVMSSRDGSFVERQPLVSVTDLAEVNEYGTPIAYGQRVRVQASTNTAWRVTVECRGQLKKGW